MTRGRPLERPEALLKSALEKVVFFECRLDQLSSDLCRANSEIERLKSEQSRATQLEIQLRQELAASESRANLAKRERDEALENAAVARQERERFLDRLIEAEQIRRAGEENEGIDLASFIAELRSEVLHLRATVSDQHAPFQPVRPAISTTCIQASQQDQEPQPEHQDAGSPCPAPASITAASLENPSPKPPTSAAPPRVLGFRSTQDAATLMASQGRIGIGEQEHQALSIRARFETRSEETLFFLSLRELAAPDSISRMRAAQRLKSLGPRAALPAIAAALNTEESPEVVCALMEVCAAAKENSILPLLETKLGSASVEVRLSALEAVFRLQGPSCLARAMQDKSSRVRRRAAVLAAGQNEAISVLEQAAGDADASVRRVAALGLAAVGCARAQSWLLSALDDNDVTVRRAAAKGLSRSFGPQVFAVADLDASRRRREIRRLVAQPTAETTPRTANATSLSATPLATLSTTSSGTVAAPSPLPHPQLESDILDIVYSALRGQSQEELRRNLKADQELVASSISSLLQRGKLVRRGQRYFVP